MLYCILLFYVVFCSVVMYFVVLYGILLCFIVLCCVLLYFVVLYCILLCFIVFCCVVLYFVVLYCIISSGVAYNCIQKQSNAVKVIKGKDVVYKDSVTLEDVIATISCARGCNLHSSKVIFLDVKL